jgi:DNA mismatch repair protein MutS2
METDETDAQKTLLEGAEVRVLSYKQRGTLVRREKSGAWLVEIGSIRAVFPAEDLVPVHASPPRPAPVLTDLSRDSAAVLELNLLGMRLEEALDALRRQLDAAVLAGLPSFAVVHGKGGGILQHGVHDFLQHDPRIVGFAFSRPELGGFGRTEVTISE